MEECSGAREPELAVVRQKNPPVEGDRGDAYSERAAHSVNRRERHAPARAPSAQRVRRFTPGPCGHVAPDVISRPRVALL